jgi:hypothetical protein
MRLPALLPNIAIGKVCSNVPDSTHIRRKVVHLIHVASSLEAIFPLPQVHYLDFVSGTRFVFRVFNINSAYPVSVGFETPDKMMADEASRASYENSPAVVHRFSCYGGFRTMAE